MLNNNCCSDLEHCPETFVFGKISFSVELTELTKLSIQIGARAENSDHALRTVPWSTLPKVADDRASSMSLVSGG